MEDVRGELQAWLRATLPADWPACGLGDWTAAWQRQLFEAGWATPTWPVNLGGRGLDAAGAAIVNTELAAVDAPVPYNMVTVAMVGETVLVHGAPEQQTRWLPDLASRRTIWCQLFSEPGAGSDLASLSTRAERDGDGWVVSGQKVWSSFAADASFGLLLARSDPTLPKQTGISAFVLAMDSSGVEVRPLRQMTGDSQFCEVFLDEVRIHDDDRLGPVNGGWAVARTMLSAERGMLGGEGASPVARVGGVDVETVMRVGQQVGPTHRDVITQAWMRDRVVAMLSGRVGADGRWAPVVKIAQAVHNQRLQELAVQVVGPTVIANEGHGLAPDVGWGLLRSRANSIGGGTSEILRNIVGESILELPREPDPYRGRPWQEIPRS
jgi:alkylation response protein AidB-like acyl-CoA dehydrogenase